METAVNLVDVALIARELFTNTEGTRRGGQDKVDAKWLRFFPFIVDKVSFEIS